jgi:hypothetical protein
MATKRSKEISIETVLKNVKKMYRKDMNKIDAIRYARSKRPDWSLLAAKEFVDEVISGEADQFLADLKMAYSCAACDEELMPGSQPIMVEGRGLCAECAAEATDAEVTPESLKAYAVRMGIPAPKKTAVKSEPGERATIVEARAKAMSERPMDHMSFDEFMVRLKAAGFVSTEQWLRDTNQTGGAQ